MTSTSRGGITPQTLTADLAMGARKLVAKTILPLGLVSVLLAGYLTAMGRPGGLGLVAIGLGCCVVFSVWQGHGISVPLLPLVAVQHLMVYGLPIAITNDITTQYPAGMITRAGLEVLTFLIALAAGWRFGMRIFQPSPPVAYTLRILHAEGNSGLRRIGYILILSITLYSFLQSVDLLSIVMNVLPSGSESIISALATVVGMCGFFIIALEVGSGTASGQNAAFFWVLFAANCLLTAAGLLLSSTTGFVGATAIGLFWGSQRLPWRFLAIVLTLLAFLNLGKYEMRGRYWETSDDFIPYVSLGDMPARYTEWSQVSLEALTNPVSHSKEDRTLDTNDNSLLARIDNLQNLLYVMNEEETHHTPLLQGATYSIIPSLLIPRILWPDKPRAHEGQVMLNVHFGRQDLISSYRAYIAWGLLPEAYGNFGPWFGAIALGLVLGVLCAWFENAFSNKPVLSLEGFLAFTIFLGVAASFEMVASVLVTSLFQAVVVVIGACLPFVDRTTVARPDPRSHHE